MAKETLPTQDLAVIEDPEDMIAAMRGDLVPEIEDPEVIAAQIMERILTAETADEVLGGTTAVHAQDVLTRPFTLHGLRLMKSRFDAGLPVFAVLDAEFMDDGSREAVTCSARNVVAQAVQLYRLGGLPRVVKIVQSDTPTANGYNVLWMEAA